MYDRRYYLGVRLWKTTGSFRSQRLGGIILLGVESIVGNVGVDSPDSNHHANFRVNAALAIGLCEPRSLGGH